jgi:hypothetical protein
MRFLPASENKAELRCPSHAASGQNRGLPKRSVRKLSTKLTPLNATQVISEKTNFTVKTKIEWKKLKYKFRDQNNNSKQIRREVSRHQNNSFDP